MSFLGQGLQIGGAVASGINQGQQQNLQRQQIQQEMGQRQHQQDREDFLAKLQAQLGQGTANRAQQELELRQQQGNRDASESLARIAGQKETTAAAAHKNSPLSPQETEAYGMPEGSLHSDVSPFAQVKRGNSAHDMAAAAMEQKWAALNHQQFHDSLQQKIAERGQAAKQEQDAYADYIKLNGELTDQLNHSAYMSDPAKKTADEATVETYRQHAADAHERVKALDDEIQAAQRSGEKQGHIHVKAPVNPAAGLPGAGVSFDPANRGAAAAEPVTSEFE